MNTVPVCVYVLLLDKSEDYVCQIFSNIQELKRSSLILSDHKSAISQKFGNLLHNIVKLYLVWRADS